MAGNSGKRQVQMSRTSGHLFGATITAIAATLVYPVHEILADQPTQPSVASQSLNISWNNNFLTVRGEFPGREIKVLYLEAYCRAGSTDRDWGETVIPHTTEKLSGKDGSGDIRLRDTLKDGVVVNH